MATGLSVSLSATSTPGPITALGLTPTHTMALLCVYLCVLVYVPTHRAISRYSGPTGEPTTRPPFPTLPCMSDTGALMAPQPPKDSTATWRVRLLGDEGSGSVVTLLKVCFNLDVMLPSVKKCPLATRANCSPG